MSQCLHCRKPCAEDAVFCEECQTRSENAFLITPINEPPSENEASPFSTIPLFESENNSTDQAVVRLNAAARQIEEESGGKRMRRSSRLAPLRDISADIQRASTPHLRITRQTTFDTQPDMDQVDRPEKEKELVAQKTDSSRTWQIQESSEDEKESDLWANSTDPLIARSRPTAAEAASIEEADIRRAQFENHTTLPYPSFQARPRRPRRAIWPIVFGVMVVLAVVVLVIDGLLLSFALNHAKHLTSVNGTPPTLTLSDNVANIGQTMSLQIAHFAPQTRVVLTHDIQETLFTTSQTTVLDIDASGEARASFAITTSWEPGSHLIVAEDITTRDTASAILQVGEAWPSRPPHLLLNVSALNLGAGVQGTATIQPLALHNAGSGSITWSVSSNQPWLLLAPQQGTFGSGQTISVAVQRNNMAPGKYQGVITISSSVDDPERLPVTMTVNALPPNAGPMISLSPPLFSFTSEDGLSTPQMQVLTLSNPGQQSLHWSITTGSTTATTIQNAYQQSSGGEVMPETDHKANDSSSWLNVVPASGTLASGQSTQVRIIANAQSVLPGVYMSTVTFNAVQGTQAYDTPQMAAIALTIQPHCGLLTGTGLLGFTAVVGQSNPSPHVLSLATTSSCSGEPINWRALPSANWISITPGNGEVKGTASSFASIAVNTAGLKPGKYNGLITFQVGKDTQTVVVQLTLQPPPAPSAPILGALPLSLNFSAVQGQANPTGQVVTITNNGGSPLKWETGLTMLTNSWITETPTQGTVPPGQTGQMTVQVLTSSLTPGTYTAQITLFGTDSNRHEVSGSPQTITVSATVQPPCSLSQPSTSSLLFSGSAGGANPTSQTVTLTGAGSCAWPLHWNASVASGGGSWLSLSPTTGTMNAASQQGNILVGINTNGLQPGTYTALVKINASDQGSTPAQNSPQSVTVTLTVLQPCTLQQLASSLSFSAPQGQSSALSQTFKLSETGSCAGGVAWTATGDVGSSGWLSFSASSGIDNGSGSNISVSAAPGNLLPGTYTGQITISASNNGMVLQGSPQIIPVTFTISGYTVSGTALACSSSDPGCASASGLGGATISLTNSSGNIIATVTADTSGNFTFTNVPLGSYTLSVSGRVNGSAYNATSSVSVNGNTNNVTVQTFSS